MISRQLIVFFSLALLAAGQTYARDGNCISIEDVRDEIKRAIHEEKFGKLVVTPGPDLNYSSSEGPDQPADSSDLDSEVVDFVDDEEDHEAIHTSNIHDEEDHEATHTSNIHDEEDHEATHTSNIHDEIDHTEIPEVADAVEAHESPSIVTPEHKSINDKIKLFEKFQGANHVDDEPVQAKTHPRQSPTHVETMDNLHIAPEVQHTAENLSKNFETDAKQDPIPFEQFSASPKRSALNDWRHSKPEEIRFDSKQLNVYPKNADGKQALGGGLRATNEDYINHRYVPYAPTHKLPEKERAGLDKGFIRVQPRPVLQNAPVRHSIP